MKHFFLLIPIIFLGHQFSLAQDSTNPDIERTRTSSSKQVRNVFYVEALGNAGGYSLNYEQSLGSSLWARAGLSYVSGAGDRLLTVPIGLSKLFGKERDFFELGLVLSPAYAEDDFILDSENEGKEFGILISPTIGYRYQSIEDVFFKIAFTPLVTTFETTFFPWGGISVGYSF